LCPVVESVDCLQLVGEGAFGDQGDGMVCCVGVAETCAMESCAGVVVGVEVWPESFLKDFSPSSSGAMTFLDGGLALLSTASSFLGLEMGSVREEKVLDRVE
jgi:hypothetical protein